MDCHCRNSLVSDCSGKVTGSPILKIKIAANCFCAVMLYVDLLKTLKVELNKCMKWLRKNIKIKNSQNSACKVVVLLYIHFAKILKRQMSTYMFSETIL